MKNRLILIIIAILLFGVGHFASAASYYNWGNSDDTLLHQKVYDTVTGHDHDGVNSKRSVASTVVITAGATPTLTIATGLNFLATDTITTDNQDQTVTFSAGGSVGQECTIIFTTDTGGSGDEVITFGTTLANTTGTLTLANLTAGVYTVSFKSDGTVWQETSRTGAQT